MTPEGQIGLGIAHVVEVREFDVAADCREFSLPFQVLTSVTGDDHVEKTQVFRHGRGVGLRGGRHQSDPPSLVTLLFKITNHISMIGERLDFGHNLLGDLLFQVARPRSSQNGSRAAYAGLCLNNRHTDSHNKSLEMRVPSRSNTEETVGALLFGCRRLVVGNLLSNVRH